jgi:hypothetical protein
VVGKYLNFIALLLDQALHAFEGMRHMLRVCIAFVLFLPAIGEAYPRARRSPPPAGFDYIARAGKVYQHPEHGAIYITHSDGYPAGWWKGRLVKKNGELGKEITFTGQAMKRLGATVETRVYLDSK